MTDHAARAERAIDDDLADARRRLDAGERISPIQRILVMHANDKALADLRPIN